MTTTNSDAVRREVRRSLRTVSDLAAANLIRSGEKAPLEGVAERYAIAVTPHLADLIDRADPDDVISRQFVPSPAELEHRPEERLDPIGDGAHSPVKGLVHRHSDRVLLQPVMVCPVYCRFCFRREQVGAGGLSEAEMDAALAYIADRSQIREVILTGGDPLMLGEARLGALMERLASIDHLDLIRIHTRVPVADPARVTPGLVQAIRAGGGKAVWLAIHVNHSRELSGPTLAAIAALADAGVALLSQTVLLKGVNADARVLEELFRGLLKCRVKPYYLHHPDLAPGTGHFRVSIVEGQEIMRALRQRLTGMGLPTYVLDIPGGAGKVPLGPEYWGQAQGAVTDPSGRIHAYPPPPV